MYTKPFPSPWMLDMEFGFDCPNGLQGGDILYWLTDNARRTGDVQRATEHRYMYTLSSHSSRTVRDSKIHDIFPK